MRRDPVGTYTKTSLFPVKGTPEASVYRLRHPTVVSFIGVVDARIVYDTTRLDHRDGVDLVLPTASYFRTRLASASLMRRFASSWSKYRPRTKCSAAMRTLAT